jgi:glutamine amidotransferase
MKNSNINIVKSGVGNIGSVVRVINDLEYESKIINNPNEFSETKKIILPGVGSFDSFINSLKSKKLFNKIQDLVINKNYSILGICVGMQSLFLESEEGTETGLGFINSKCKKFDSKIKKVPHIGWNNIIIKKQNKLFDDIENNYFYFAHSYNINDIEKEFTLSTTKYIYEFVSSISWKNIYGVQFHPEKSFQQGKQVIKNFIEKC